MAISRIACYSLMSVIISQFTCMLNAIMLNVILSTVILLTVTLLNVIFLHCE
jgi:hypothetical protein